MTISRCFSFRSCFSQRSGSLWATTNFRLRQNKFCNCVIKCWKCLRMNRFWRDVSHLWRCMGVYMDSFMIWWGILRSIKGRVYRTSIIRTLKATITSFLATTSAAAASALKPSAVSSPSNSSTKKRSTCSVEVWKIWKPTVSLDLPRNAPNDSMKMWQIPILYTKELTEYLSRCHLLVW